MRFDKLFARLSPLRVLTAPGALLSCALILYPFGAHAQNAVSPPGNTIAAPTNSIAPPPAATPAATAVPAAAPDSAATGTGAAATPASSETNEFSGTNIKASDSGEIKDNSGPPSLDEYNNVPTNMMIPEQAVVKDAEGNDVVDSHLNTGVKTGYETLLKLYQEGKYEEVAKGLTPLAAVAHHGAQELLGIMYEQGQGVTKDPHKAYDLLMQAADAGNRPLAQHHLGVMYYQGDGVSKDALVALMWLHIAIVHYPDGAEKARAIKDRDSIYMQLTRREKERALQLAREWLGKKGESDLLDLQGN